MPLFTKTVKRKIIATGLIILLTVCGVTLGFIFRIGYEMWRYPEVYFERNDIRGETEIVAGGERYMILPILTTDRANFDRVSALLPKFHIHYTISGRHILVAEKQVPLAIDLLHLTGITDSARYFSTFDITADPQIESLRYKLQQQLASQNSLARKIAGLYPDFSDVRVIGDPSIPSLTIKIVRRAAAGPLDSEVVSQITTHAHHIFPEITPVKISVIEQASGKKIYPKP